MKFCTTCGRTYAEPDVDACPYDGTPLFSMAGEEAEAESSVELVSAPAAENLSALEPPSSEGSSGELQDDVALAETAAASTGQLAPVADHDRDDDLLRDSELIEESAASSSRELPADPALASPDEDALASPEYDLALPSADEATNVRIDDAIEGTLGDLGSEDSGYDGGSALDETYEPSATPDASPAAERPPHIEPVKKKGGSGGLLIGLLLLALLGAGVWYFLAGPGAEPEVLPAAVPVDEAAPTPPAVVPTPTEAAPAPAAVQEAPAEGATVAPKEAEPAAAEPVKAAPQKRPKRRTRRPSASKKPVAEPPATPPSPLPPTAAPPAAPPDSPGAVLQEERRTIVLPIEAKPEPRPQGALDEPLNDE